MALHHHVGQKRRRRRKPETKTSLPDGKVSALFTESVRDLNTGSNVTPIPRYRIRNYNSFSHTADSTLTLSTDRDK